MTPDTRAVPAFSALSQRAQAMEQDAALIADLAGAVVGLIAEVQRRTGSSSGRYCPTCGTALGRPEHAADCVVGKALAVVERAEGQS